VIYTGPAVKDLARIPAELTCREQWVLWRGEDRVDRTTGEITLTKIPVDPQTLRNASSTDPSTWGTFQQCVMALPVALEEWEHTAPAAYRGGGLGFVFSDDDPYSGVDLDHCRNPDTGELAPRAQLYVEALASYTELSPSGAGVHVWVEGLLPPHGRKHGQVEMYTSGRFFTITGWHVPDTPKSITAHQEALYEVHGRVFGPQVLTAADGTTRCYCPGCDYLCTLTARGLCPACGTPPIAPAMVPPPPASSPQLEDAALLQAAGARFRALYGGDWSAYASHSEADMGLCVRLVFWTRDPDQIDRLFRQSGLMRPKWDAKHGAQTYGQMTIAKALAVQTTHYQPGHGTSADGYTWGTPGQTPRPRTRAWNPPDFVDPWLGPRSQWCGIPLDVRRV
jgi:putative DNA primase/helicase